MKCLTPYQVVSTGEFVPCGCCYACMTNKRNSWDLRLRFENLAHSNNAFVTLTYNNDSLPSDGLVKKVDLKKFIKDFRNHFGEFRYYAVAEYGENTGRPHYHIMVFSNHGNLSDIIYNVFKCWRYGFNDVGDINDSSIHYITKWHIIPKKPPIKFDSIEYHGFTLMSKGIGRNFLNQLTVENITPTYSFFGKRLPVDRYYRKKLSKKVDDVLSIFDYVKRKYKLTSIIQVNHKITELQNLYEKKLKNPRKSIF